MNIIANELMKNIIVKEEGTNEEGLCLIKTRLYNIVLAFNNNNKKNWYFILFLLKYFI